MGYVTKNIRQFDIAQENEEWCLHMSIDNVYDSELQEQGEESSIPTPENKKNEIASYINPATKTQLGLIRKFEIINMEIQHDPFETLFQNDLFNIIK